jgi:hypothetical protein
VFLKFISKFPSLVLLGVCLLVATLFTQEAKADALYDFGCSAGACTGTVTGSFPDFSTTASGILGLSGGQIVPSAPFDTGATFTLFFDTTAGTISLVEDDGDQLLGTITGVSLGTSSDPGTTNIDLTATWYSIPADMLGVAGSTPTSSVITITNSGQAFSVDIPITTPEPAVPALLGAGLAALGLVRKRKAVALT